MSNQSEEEPGGKLEDEQEQPGKNRKKRSSSLSAKLQGFFGIRVLLTRGRSFLISFIFIHLLSFAVFFLLFPSLPFVILVSGPSLFLP